MEIVVRSQHAPAPDDPGVEVVERKGRGHPDSMCDGMAESVSLALSRLYVERAGEVLHHNVDKILLAAGSSRPEPGGGTVLASMDVYLAGRVTRELAGQTLPVDDVAVDACRRWIRTTFRALDPERHIRFHTRFRTVTRELSALVAGRGSQSLAADSSIGVGFAPFTELERLVRGVEEHLNSPATKGESPEIGEDIKVLGVRVGDRIELTVACAFVAAHVASVADYVGKKARLAERVARLSHEVTGRTAAVSINAGDMPERGLIYLTVTGTSAECGDDGQVGRGNRVNGLITPHRPMTIEAFAGKNPRNHVGKLYQLSAQRIAASVSEVKHVSAAECCLVSQIGQPLAEPRLADVVIAQESGQISGAVRGEIERIVKAELGLVPGLWREILRGEVAPC